MGKTSVGKSLRGELFDESERSTDGVQMFSFAKNAGTADWKNPPYLEDNTVFDQRITEEVIREIRSTDAQQMAELFGDEHEGTSENGKYFFLFLNLIFLGFRLKSMVEVFC